MDTASALRTGVEIPIRDAALAGDLTVPSNPSGLVIFAHGSGLSQSGIASWPRPSTPAASPPCCSTF
jgi:hypothetical protein